MKFTGEGNYVNCLDKDLEEIKSKNQGFDEATKKIVNTILDNSKNGLNLNQISFKNIFNLKYKTIMWTIIIIISVIIFIINSSFVIFNKGVS
jgi:hypothetical protein